MFETLDAIIATGAVILGLSLIVQSIQQILKQYFDLKSSYMRAQILALFSPSRVGQNIAENMKVANWKTLESLAKGRAGEFAKELVRQLESKLSTFGFTNLHLIEDIPIERFKEMVKSLPIAAEEKFKSEYAKAMGELDLWYDIGKKAFQEHYERRMKPWAIAISAVVVIVLNANLIDIYTEFARDKPLRQAAVSMGERFIATPKEQLIITMKEGTADTQRVALEPDSVIVKNMRARVDSIRVILDGAGFQVFRWNKWQRYHVSGPGLPRAILGWTCMILLVSLGAPFWYDFLKAVAGVKDRLKASAQALRNR